MLRRRRPLRAGARAIVAAERAQQPQRPGERSRRAPPSRRVQLGVEQRERLVTPPEGVERQRLQRAPRCPRRIVDPAQPRVVLVGRAERLVPSTLIEQQLELGRRTSASPSDAGLGLPRLGQRGSSAGVIAPFDQRRARNPAP